MLFSFIKIHSKGGTIVRDTLIAILKIDTYLDKILFLYSDHHILTEDSS